jgi:signal transduction histidine kinase
MQGMRLSIRLTLVMVALVAATVIGILFFTNRALETITGHRALAQAGTHARLLANKLEDKIDNLKSDALLLTTTSTITEFVRTRSNGGQRRNDAPTKDPPWQDRISGFLRAKLAANPSYLRFSIIGVDDGGRELMRLDWSGADHGVRVVPANELQRKGDTAYFREAIKLKAGDVYVSDVQFNREIDRSVSPDVPVMHVATPIVGSDGSRHGAIVITVDARSVLDVVRSIESIGMSTNGHQVYLVSDRGEYLIHPDRTKEFTNGSAGRVIDEMLELVGAINGDQSQSRMMTDNSGETYGVGVAPVRPARGAWFGVLVMTPYAEIMAPIAGVRRSSLVVGLIAILCTVGLAALLARSIARPLAQMTKAVNAFSPGRPLVMPATALNATGEVGVLARSFDQMAAEVLRKGEELKHESEGRERMKDEFVAMVSHELRTPLTSISASLGLLIADPAGKLSDAAMRLLRIAHSNSQRLVRLINDVLDIEKIESGRVEFNMKNLDARRLIEQAIEGNRGYADQFEVKVRMDSDAANAVIRADADRMTQVVTNLLSNAVKFSPTHGEVLVTITNVGPMARIAVRDHGPGVPEKFRDKIFEKFAQADAIEVRQKGGTGLGLSIVKQIVVRLGGDAGFKEAPGGGTIFYVDLPRAQGEVIAGDAAVSVTTAVEKPDDQAVGRGSPQKIEFEPKREVA